MNHQMAANPSISGDPHYVHHARGARLPDCMHGSAPGGPKLRTQLRLWHMLWIVIKPLLFAVCFVFPIMSLLISVTRFKCTFSNTTKDCKIEYIQAVFGGRQQAPIWPDEKQ